MNIHFPYQFNTAGRTAETDEITHIRHLMEQILFTNPGERVNRPNFGCGLLQLVFRPNSQELAATTQYLVQGALQQYLSHLISVQQVAIENEDATLRITIAYRINRTQEEQVAQFTR